VLQGPAESPIVLLREEVPLSDRGKPKTWQPFHAVMDLPWEKALAATRPAAQAARAAGARSLRELQTRARGAGAKWVGAGIVAGGAIDPATIGNPHIRAHAAEGRFFREAAEAGADACRLARHTFPQKSVFQEVAAVFGCSVATLKTRATALGAGRIKPWGAEEKEAAVAAWAVLFRRKEGPR
jgi:hypothetical protein